MTKKELSQIYYINKEIEMWERELQDVIKLQSPDITGTPKGTQTGDSTARTAVRCVEIRKKIERLILELQMKRSEIYDFIETIDDSMMRQIIMYRCIYLWSWEEVAQCIGGGNTADGIRMAFVRFLDK